MGYRLGVDLGTSFTAATISHAGMTAGAPLAADCAIVPSVVYIGTDGGRLYGTAAVDAAGADSAHLLRGFVRRIGDETPMVPEVGASTAAHRIAADLVAWVVAQATVQEGHAPEAVAVTHPATWGPHKRELLAAALREAGVPCASLVSEPVAVAVGAGDRPAGAVVAVYDLGGRTFDAALVRRDESGTWTTIGRPAGLPDLGGADIDDLVLAHVIGGLSPDQQQAVAALDAEDEPTAAALAGLRAACVRAKESLSTDAAASIAVQLPGITGKVRLTRSEFETMISSSIEATIDVLDAVVDSASLTAEDLDCVLISGGASRIPLVTQMLSGHFGRPVVPAGGTSPATAVAAGAVLSLGEFAAPAPAVPPATPAVKAVVETAVKTAVKTGVKTAKPKPVRKMARVAKAPVGTSVAQAPAVSTTAPPAPAAGAAPAAKAPAAVVPGPAKPANPLPHPAGPGSKPIRARRGARRAEVVGLEGLSALAPAGLLAEPAPEGPRAVVPPRAVRSLDTLLAEQPERAAREEHLPPPRPALDDMTFAAVEEVEVETTDAGWTWRSVVSIRRSLALTVLTAAIFVGSTAWNPATPTITDKPVTDVQSAAAKVSPAKRAAN